MDHHVASTSDADLVGRVDAALDREVAALEPWLTEVGDELLPFLAQAERAVGGGKRLRALLCLAAYEVAGGESPVPEHVVDAAAALELFQGAALVHDDLMDASDTRRGEPSAHRALASASPRDSGRDAFGAGAAILLGDLLLTRSSTVLFDAVRRTPEGPGGAVSALYSDMATEVAVGQYLDLLASHAHWDDDVDLDRAFRVIRAKSARYSVEIPLALGATLASTDGLVGWLRQIGHEVGTAFQLRDDLLGVFGDPQRTGKPAGDDLREGKRTVLVALAHAHGDAALRARLEADLGREDLTREEIGSLAEAIARSGAERQVEDLIAAHSARADALLADPPAGVGSAARLERLLRAAVQRSA